ncbi:ABC transporter substrate-binding protein [Ornithinibacillus bavariensis]|uniref:Spermidine/putrescine ABC transporter substrate-binding protein n=1 Tax=Ornithinibacillus bavariensis TaxID=545502 RepID=A0A919X8H6_9BACI|nr:spermidine/putrescine ABC transporter substrate-binding protein [Ornithinibacillus bavariensis]GIO26475.1 spermidine/putrescine ABC transporter substrate-binding protein [Ornithinibacillus bavariensis]HAM81695.1 spermidine/putrescine ABC transporter substrate-binding protein [Ornithinibacillus sp.]
MKKLFLFGLLSMMILFLAACGSDKEDNASGEKKLSDKLYVFNWSEYIPQEVLDDFEKEFGVDVVYSTYNSNHEMLTKVQSGTVAYDLVFPSDYYVKQMVDNDLLLEIDFDNIPNYKNIGDAWHDMPFDPDNKYSVPFMYGYDGIAYNKEFIKEPPTSWADLWNPEYKGKVALLEESKEVSNMLQQLLGNDMNDPTKEQLEEGFNKLKEVVPNVLAFDATPSDRLVSGEVWIAHAYSGSASTAWLENENIDFVLPKEGGIVWLDAMAIPKTAKNKYTAEVFINYLLRPEVSKKLSEFIPYGNPNDEALKILPDEIKNSPGMQFPDEVIKNAKWNLPLDTERTQYMNRLFQEAKVE